MRFVIAVALVIAAGLLVWQLGEHEDEAATVPVESRPVSASRPEAAPEVSAHSGPAAAPGEPNQSGSADTSGAPGVFEVSTSVHEYCGSTEWDACRQVEAFIDEMSAEPRAADWAEEMEGRIASAIASQLQGHAQIRALQCRRTRCAVEYALPVAVGTLELGGDLTFDGALVQNAGATLPEANPSGDLVVTVLTWSAGP